MSLALPERWPAAVREAGREAGRAILAVRADAAGLGVERKDDGSPVSRADRAASLILRERLGALSPTLPVGWYERASFISLATRLPPS